jgi:hypothetical protein
LDDLDEVGEIHVFGHLANARGVDSGGPVHAMAGDAEYLPGAAPAVELDHLDLDSGSPPHTHESDNSS